MNDYAQYIDAKTAITLFRLCNIIDGVCHRFGDLDYHSFKTLLLISSFKEGLKTTDIQAILNQPVYINNYCIERLNALELVSLCRYEKDRRTLAITATKKGISWQRSIGKTIKETLIASSEFINEGVLEQFAKKSIPLFATTQKDLHPENSILPLFHLLSQGNELCAKSSVIVRMPAMQALVLWMVISSQKTLSSKDIESAFVLDHIQCDLVLSSLITREFIDNKDGLIVATAEGNDRCDIFLKRYNESIEIWLANREKNSAHELFGLFKHITYTFDFIR